jgi:hypothetical protein
MALVEGGCMNQLLRTTRCPARTGLILLDGFLGATAVLGGLGLATVRFTPSLCALTGFPFTSCLIPRLALLVLVGAAVCWRPC